MCEKFDKDGNVIEKEEYLDGKMVKDYFAEEKEKARQAAIKKEQEEAARQAMIAARKKRVAEMSFEKKSDGVAREQTLKEVLAAGSRTEKMEILKKFHSAKANVPRRTALKFKKTSEHS